MLSLRASDATINSVRGNFPFDDCDNPTCTSCGSCTIPAGAEAAADTGVARTGTGFFMPPVVYRGDLARSYFYMALRYDGDETLTEDLKLCDIIDKSLFSLGYLSTVLRWHAEDPPSDAEKVRNHQNCLHMQRNRNPFIDFPGLVDLLFNKMRGGLGNHLMCDEYMDISSTPYGTFTKTGECDFRHCIF